MNSVRLELEKIYKYRYVISSYVIINLRMRYRRSFIGFLWTIIAPLLQYLIIAIVFMYAMKTAQEGFFPYFFTGSIIFNVLSITLQRAPTIMLANEIYIKKIYLPKIIYVLNTCTYELTNFFLAAGALWIMGLALQQVFLSWALLTLPLSIINLILTLIGISATLSISGVFFRDLSYILPQIMQACFFLTPIIYRLEVFPERLQKIIHLNPFYHLIETFRVPITEGKLASSEHYLISTLFSIIVFIFGYLVIKKFDNKIIFKL